MNFPPFGGHFSTAIPTIHQFAAKFSQETATGTLCQTQDNSNRYTANGVPSFTQHHPATHQQMLNSINTKYQGSYSNQTVYGQQANVRQEKRQNYEPQELAQELCAVMLQQSQQQQHEKQASDKSKQDGNDRRPQQTTQNQQQSHHHSQIHSTQPQNITQSQTVNTSTMPATWQSLATPGSAVADYLSHLPASTLPLSLHHFLKYSAENIKKETTQQLNVQSSAEPNMNLLHNNTININGLNTNGLNGNVLSGNTGSMNSLSALTTINAAQIQSPSPPKKKKKKKPEKEKKPRPKPGEIRLTTALDGSTLYCCPECHMAYPEKELLEQHLVGHTLERRFVCDICGAGLKRKDHLTRHKQSHNPERPYVCTVCLKAFKRKEQLTLHFVIHSGEKRHICTECGKGFYRKDHLRKHTRSHIARRVKAELSQQDRLKLSFDARSKLAKSPIAEELLHIMATKQTTLCVAADLSNSTDILNLAEQVGPHICILKTHIDIVEDFHPNFIKPLKEIAERHNFILFEDRKFADIGKTVELQYTKGTFKISSWAKVVTAHSITGKGLLDGIKGSEGSEKRGVFLLAELSSAGNLIDEKYTKATLKLVEEYPDLIAGIVCQNPLFLDNPGLVQLTPGVQLDTKSDNLGQRYNSPNSVVLDKGADVAIVGRGITKATDPGIAAEQYKNILWDAYLKRVQN